MIFVNLRKNSGIPRLRRFSKGKDKRLATRVDLDRYCCQQVDRKLNDTTSAPICRDGPSVRIRSCVRPQLVIIPPLGASGRVEDSDTR